MAEETSASVTETVTESQKSAAEKGQAADTSESTEKTFTQSELDAAIKSRLERERRNQPSKDELKAFHEWQESHKSAEERTADRIKQAEEAKSAAELKAAEFEAKYTAAAKGVRNDALEDVIALAKGRVGDDTTMDQLTYFEGYT